MKIAKVLPLFKKDDNRFFGNYRPILLLSSVSKIFERIAFNQLYDYIISNDLSFDGQYGFRDKHSTELAASELIDRLSNEIDHKKIPLSIFLDLSKAFDTLDHDIRLSKLEYYGVKSTSLKWFAIYLKGRSQCKSALKSACKSALIYLFSYVSSVPNCFVCKTWSALCAPIIMSLYRMYQATSVLMFTIPVKWYRYHIFHDYCECQSIAIDQHLYTPLKRNAIVMSGGFCASGHFCLLWKSPNVHLYKPGCYIVICAMSYKPCSRPV